jgi:hypothetical protein
MESIVEEAPSAEERARVEGRGQRHRAGGRALGERRGVDAGVRGEELDRAAGAVVVEEREPGGEVAGVLDQVGEGLLVGDRGPSRTGPSLVSELVPGAMPGEEEQDEDARPRHRRGSPPVAHTPPYRHNASGTWR